MLQSALAPPPPPCGEKCNLECFCVQTYNSKPTASVQARVWGSYSSYVVSYQSDIGESSCVLATSMDMIGFTLVDMYLCMYVFIYGCLHFISIVFSIVVQDSL